MTYDELVASIEAYTENQFPDVVLADGSVQTTKQQLDTFIRQTEQRVYNTVQFPALRKNMFGAVSVLTPYLAAPEDYLATYSMSVVDAAGQHSFLLNKDVSFIRAAYPSVDDKGLPRFYAIFGPTVYGSDITAELSFLLGPSPDDNYRVELNYYYYPESITTVASGRTWLGDNFDSVLLYGALVEANTFMKGEADLVALYDNKYMAALAMAKRLGDGLERSDAYRSGQARVAPLPPNFGVL